MIRKRFAIRIANRTKRNFSAYFATRFYRQIIERLHDFWGMIMVVRRFMRKEILTSKPTAICKTNAINKMPWLFLRKMLQYSNLIIAIQSANNQVVILA